MSGTTVNVWVIFRLSTQREAVTVPGTSAGVPSTGFDSRLVVLYPLPPEGGGGVAVHERDF